MLKQIIPLVMLTGIISGCTTTQDVDTLPDYIDVQTLDAALAAQQANIVTAVRQDCRSQTESLAALTQQLGGMNRQLAQLQVKPEQKLVRVPANCPKSPLGDKFMLGEVEFVFIDELKASFATRIDTGAESSSLDARNIILFERDGRQWVRFDVFTHGEDAPAETFESKVERFVRIKQEAGEKYARRPVIHAHLTIGQYVAETDLNLSNRSHLEYPLLLGRKFMQDIAVVDVGQRYIHGKAQNPVTAAGK